MLPVLFGLFFVSHATCWCCHTATRRSNTVDRRILEWALVGQLVGFVGLCLVGCGVWPAAHRCLIDCSHYGFVATLVSGVFLFSELHNLLLLLSVLVTTLTTRLWLGKCMFDYASVFYLPIPEWMIDYNYIFALMILYTAYRGFVRW